MSQIPIASCPRGSIWVGPALTSVNFHTFWSFRSKMCIFSTRKRQKIYFFELCRIFRAMAPSATEQNSQKQQKSSFFRWPFNSGRNYTELGWHTGTTHIQEMKINVKTSYGVTFQPGEAHQTFWNAYKSAFFVEFDHMPALVCITSSQFQRFKFFDFIRIARLKNPWWCRELNGQRFHTFPYTSPQRFEQTSRFWKFW